MKNRENTKQEGKLRQLVSVRLGGEEYGIDIALVHDIHRMVKITQIPQAPPYLQGVINLRGQIIPVVDFRQLFKIDGQEASNGDKRIVVIESGQTVGFIVDGVSEVLRIPESAIKEPPEMIKTQVDTRYIEGVAQLSDSRLIIVLDIGTVFTIL